MVIIISPTKTMRVINEECTKPLFLDRAEEVRAYLKSLSFDELKSIYKCNDKIVEENIRSLNSYKLDSNLTRAIKAYDGLQFKNIDVDSLDKDSLAYLNRHLRIISAQYGLLRPSDGIIPYRLEMQARVNLNGFTSMYKYWSDSIYRELSRGDDIIINLCSKEYSDAITPFLEPNKKMVTIIFGNLLNGKISVKGTEAKMNRGRMVRYMALNRVSSLEEIKLYTNDGFCYNEELSSDEVYYFIKNNIKNI